MSKDRFWVATIYWKRQRITYWFPSCGMLSKPVCFFGTFSFDIRRQHTIKGRRLPSVSLFGAFSVLTIDLGLEFALLSFFAIRTFQVKVTIIIHAERMTRGLEMYKHGSIKPAFQREGMAMNARGRFKQQHFSWMQSDVVCSTLVIINFRGPIFIQVLCHVENGGGDQGESIHTIIIESREHHTDENHSFESEPMVPFTSTYCGSIMAPSL